jgi:hypothetical protein
MKKTLKVLPPSPGVRSIADQHSLQTKAVISARAYEFYVARGCQPGLDVQDWLRAEAEIMRQRIDTLAM